MNKKVIRSISMMMAVICVICSLGFAPLKALAVDTVAVQGTIASGTTASLLLLNTEGGQMKIKMDPTTDTTNCKLFIVGYTVKVDIYRGDDAYMHAATVSLVSTSSTTTTTNSATNNAMVSGTIKDDPKADSFVLSTILGDVTIKFNSNTDLSGCQMLIKGRIITATVSKGSDNNYYASKIVDVEGANTVTSNTVSNVSGTTTTISGTVASGTTSSVLYLSTNSGTMTIKLDSNTNASAGRILCEGLTITAVVYTGSDNYLHAASLSGNRTASNASVDSNTVTVCGTVDAKSTQDILRLNTSAGTYLLRMDSTTAADTSLILTSGRAIKVTIARGSDAYMHAVSIALQ